MIIAHIPCRLIDRPFYCNDITINESLLTKKNISEWFLYYSYTQVKHKIF